MPVHPADINQVLLNLVVNAAHAIGDALQDQEGAKGKVTVRTRKLESQVEIRIEDTGTGMPGTVLGRIFDPFFTTKEVGKGTGQGLAISHQVVVKKHDGSIDVETEVGRGTTLIVRLPLVGGDSSS